MFHSDFVISLPEIYLALTIIIWVFWIHYETKRRGFELCSFPVLAGAMYIIGAYKSVVEEIIGVDQEYLFFSRANYEPATRFCFLCFIALVFGYVLFDSARIISVKRITLLTPAAKSPLGTLAWSLLIIGAVAKVEDLGYILYSTDGHGAHSFDTRSVFQRCIFFMPKIVFPLVAGLGPILSSKPPWPHRSAVAALVICCFFDLITFSRMQTLTSAVALLGSMMLMSIRWRAMMSPHQMRRSRTYLFCFVGAVLFVNLLAREAYRHSRDHSTGILSVVRVLEEWQDEPTGDTEKGIPAPIGGVHTLSIVMSMNQEGHYQPLSEFLYELNPFPNVDKADESGQWLSKQLGIFGSFGMPQPMEADFYNFFSWFGCLFFIPIGWLSYRLWTRALHTIKSCGNNLPLNQVMWYTACLMAYWQGISGINFRTYSRGFFNCFIFLYILNLVVGNRKIRGFLTIRGSKGHLALPQNPPSADRFHRPNPQQPVPVSSASGIVGASLNDPPQQSF